MLEWVIVGAMKGNSLLGGVAALLPHVEHVAAFAPFQIVQLQRLNYHSRSLHNYGSQCRDYDEIR